MHVLMQIHKLKKEWDDWNKHTVPPMFACNYAKEVEQTWGVRWTCIHVLINVHIFIKMWDHKQGDWDTYTVTHMSIQVSI